MIEVINVPLGERVKLFPPNAKVRATLPLTLLGTVKASDFSLVVDYEAIVSSKEKQLDELIKQLDEFIGEERVRIKKQQPRLIKIKTMKQTDASVSKVTYQEENF